MSIYGVTGYAIGNGQTKYINVHFVLLGIVWSNGLQNASVRKFVMPALCPGLGPQTLEQKVQNEALHLVEQITASPCLENSDDLRDVVYKAVCNIKCAVIFGQR